MQYFHFFLLLHISFVHIFSLFSGPLWSYFTNHLSWLYWCCTFFLAGTSYDRIRLVYLDEMGGVAIPMPKIFTMFSSFSMASLALPGMSGFVAEVIVFLGIITSQKYLHEPS